MQSRALFLSCIHTFALLTVDSAFAQSSAEDSLQAVVVTATRSAQPIEQVGDSVTLITSGRIRASQKTALSDLLATTPGVAISRNGGLGQTTSLRIRGAETDQTVILIDGVKLNDPSAPGGGYNFGNLLADDLSRIEVLRGPQSTLWGSQAIGGVINLITPIPEGPLSSSLNLEGGSRDTAQVRARIESGGDRLAWRFGGSYLTTDDVSAFDEDLGGRERDGYRHVGFNARGILTIADGLSAELRSMYSRGKADFDGFPPPLFQFADTGEYSDTRELVGYAGLNAELLDGRFANRLGYAYTDTDRESFNPATVIGRSFDAYGRNERIEYQGTLAIARGYEAVFGVESEKSELRTAAYSDFDPSPVPLRKEVRIDSAFAQLTASPVTALTLTAGLRRDDHEEFGGQTTGRASVAWSLARNTIVRASFGEGFKAPTLYQFYSEYGNVALDPEEARGWDAGIEQRFANDRASFSATYFRRDTDNMIDFVSCFGSSDPRCAAQPFGFYDNVQRTVAQGVEVEGSAQVGERVAISANYTRTEARNDVRTSPNFERDLVRRPRDTAAAQVSYAWPAGFSAAVTVQYVGASFDNQANTVRLDEYTLVDLRAEYALNEGTQIYARLENALDEDYETARRYGSLGRGAFAGVRIAF